MKWLCFLVVFLSMSNGIIIFDQQHNSSKWYSTNDDVMGGVSTSKMELLESGVALFSGTISTAFNGGFAMTRLPLNVKLDADKSKVILTVKGDGKKYQLRIKSKKYQRYWYVQIFETSKGLQEIELPLKEFYPSFRGYRLDAPAFSSSQLREMAILIGNKKNESFALEVHKIIIE